MSDECERPLPILVAGARRLDITLDDAQEDAFLTYCRVLQEWSTHTNLTAIRTPDGIMLTLFLDSLSLAPTIGAVTDNPGRLRMIDIGAGAGFPSLPLKIVYPDWKLVLVESVGKKTRFLCEIVERLGLSGVSIHNQRAEELGHNAQFRDGFDVAVARAVSALPALLELCGPFVRMGGHVILPKSGPVEEEITAAQEAAQRLGLRLERVDDVDPSLGLGEGRAAVVYVKHGPTPPGYPRRTGLAQSRPIGSQRAGSR